jgi:hypothetical protein
MIRSGVTPLDAVRGRDMLQRSWRIMLTECGVVPSVLALSLLRFCLPTKPHLNRSPFKMSLSASPKTERIFGFVLFRPR